MLTSQIPDWIRQQISKSCRVPNLFHIPRSNSHSALRPDSYHAILRPTDGLNNTLQPCNPGTTEHLTHVLQIRCSRTAWLVSSNLSTLTQPDSYLANSRSWDCMTYILHSPVHRSTHQRAAFSWTSPDQCFCPTRRRSDFWAPCWWSAALHPKLSSLGAHIMPRSGRRKASIPVMVLCPALNEYSRPVKLWNRDILNLQNCESLRSREQGLSPVTDSYTCRWSGRNQNCLIIEIINRSVRHVKLSPRMMLQRM